MRIPEKESMRWCGKEKEDDEGCRKDDRKYGGQGGQLLYKLRGRRGLSGDKGHAEAKAEGGDQDILVFHKHILQQGEMLPG